MSSELGKGEESFVLSKRECVMLICDWRSGRDGVNREVVDFLETESSILWV